MTKEKEFDLLIFIGRFQPFHLGHKKVVDQALELSKHVLILVGSAGKARTIRNPFTYGERYSMIKGVYGAAIVDQHHATPIIVEPLYDKTYNDTAWIEQIQQIAKRVCLKVANPDGGFQINGTNDIKVGLIGASKDHTSYYLKMFPQWESVDVPLHETIDATPIREGFLDGRFERYQLEETLLPKTVSHFLFADDTGFIHHSDYQQLQDELKFVRSYKKSWEAAPYPVKHVTVDAVVEQSGHVLLVRRRSAPGKGLWALPGGHLNMEETTTAGAIRELKEETKIKVPNSVLWGSIVNKELFDDPHRSTIGRVITHAFHFKLKDDIQLPKVKGSDDADKAKWIPIADLKEDELFDDHFAIISYFLSLY